MRKKVICILFLLFLMLIVMVGCNETTQEDIEIDSNKVEEVSGKEVDKKAADNGKDESAREETLSITANVHVDDDKIIVDGQTNLPEGATFNSSAIADGWAQIPFMDSAEVKPDGTFNFEFPSVKSDTAIKLSLARNSLTTELFGENFEKEGVPHRRITNDRDSFDIRMDIFIDSLKEKPFTLSIDDPEWDIPSDYGAPDIWMDVDYEITHRFIIFNGKSNLVEGTYLGGNLATSKQIEPFAFEHTEVLPDGSFMLRVPYHKLKKGLFMPIEFWPSKNASDNPIDHYGEKGEKLEGDLVWTQDDEKYIRYDVKIEDPAFDVPEDVDLTQEKEEVKIQVPDDLLFDFDKSSLKANAKATLDDILSELEHLHDGTQIEINGHTDNEGSPEYNVTLSEERAQSVHDYLEKNGKVNHLSITLHGFGEEKPIASNEDSKGRAKNRRVEIIVNPN